MNSDVSVGALGKKGSSILCVIDFSEASKDALVNAVELASSNSSALTVLYPYRLNQPRNVPNVSQWKQSIENDATNNFTRMTSTLLKESHIECEFKAEVGFVDDRVEFFTEKHDVSLIVISSEFAYKSDGTFLEMLEKLKCPLLVVPKKKIEVTNNA